jgi:hypothetical protein
MSKPGLVLERHFIDTETLVTQETLNSLASLVVAFLQREEPARMARKPGPKRAVCWGR